MEFLRELFGDQALTDAARLREDGGIHGREL